MGIDNHEECLKDIGWVMDVVEFYVDKIYFDQMAVNLKEITEMVNIAVVVHSTPPTDLQDHYGSNFNMAAPLPSAFPHFASVFVDAIYATYAFYVKCTSAKNKSATMRCNHTTLCLYELCIEL